MSEEKNFDELLRSKLSEREFFFDELNWEKAETMLKRRERLRSLKRYSAVFLGGLLAGGVIMYPLANAVKNNNSQVNIVQQQPAASSQIASGGNGNKSLTPAENNSNSDQEKKTPSENVNNASSKTVSHNNAPVPATRSGWNNHTHTNPFVANNNSNQENNSGANTSPVVVAQISQPNTKDNANRANANLETPNNISPGNNVSQVAQTNTGNNVKPQYQQENNPTPASVNNNANQHVDSKARLNDKVGQVQPSNITGTSSANSKADSGAANKTVAAVNVIKTDSAQLKKNVPNENKVIAKVDTAKKVDMTGINPANQNKDFLTQETNPIEYIKTHRPPFIISIDAGIGYGLGWTYTPGMGGINGITREGNGVCLLAGIRAAHDLSKRFALSAGLRFITLSNLNATYQNSVSAYDFGLNSTETTVNTHTLYYAALPIEVQYNVGNWDNIICVGGTFLYLVNSSGDLNTVTMDGITPPASQNKTVYGYMDGFNSLDMQINLAYRRRIYGGFYAGLEGYFGLLDVENGLYFGNLSSGSGTKNRGIRFILTYDIN